MAVAFISPAFAWCLFGGVFPQVGDRWSSDDQLKWRLLMVVVPATVLGMGFVRAAAAETIARNWPGATLSPLRHPYIRRCLLPLMALSLSILLLFVNGRWVPVIASLPWLVTATVAAQASGAGTCDSPSHMVGLLDVRSINVQTTGSVVYVHGYGTGWAVGCNRWGWPVWIADEAADASMK